MKMTLDFDRWDYLATRLLLIGALVAVAGFTLVAPLIGWLTHADLTSTISMPTSPAVTDPAPLPGVEATWDATALVSIPDAASAVWLAVLAQGVVRTVAVALVIGPLLFLVRSIQQGRGFSAATVGWVRVAALTLVIAPWVLVAVTGFTNDALLRAAFGGDDFSATFMVGAPTVVVSVAGLVLAALAEALRRGRDLEADVQGLV